MKWQQIFNAKVTLSRQEVTRGLRALTWETVASTGFSTLTSSTFLVAFAVALGAGNLQIGILASLPFITDIVQIPAVWLVEKTGLRKPLVLVLWLIAQLLWIPVALIPFFMNIPGSGAVSMLIGIMAVRGILNAFTNCGWNSWVRDLIPQKILGRFTARKESLAAGLAVVLGLGAGYFLDYWNGGGPLAYSVVLIFGLVFFGLVSPALMAFIPEPAMPPRRAETGDFSRTVIRPLKDKNYRKFLKFLMLWGFASYMAVPFFTVFMLQYLKLGIFTVIVLTTVSEVFTVISLRFWGPLADRFGSKTALQISSSLFLMVLVGWAATAIPGPGNLLFTLLVPLHILTGIAVAGITLTTGTLSFKLAPQGKATPYLTGASLAESAGIGAGLLLAGFVTELLAGRSFSLGLPAASVEFTGYHVLFLLAALLGLNTLKDLGAVYENGSARKEAVWNVLSARARQRFVIPWNLRSVFIAAPEAAPLAAVSATYETAPLPDGRSHIAKMLTGLLRKLARKPPPGGCPVFSPGFITPFALTRC